MKDYFAQMSTKLIQRLTHILLSHTRPCSDTHHYCGGNSADCDSRSIGCCIGNVGQWPPVTDANTLYGGQSQHYSKILHIRQRSSQ